MRQFLEQALEDIDASIFSGDLLHCDEERDELKEYIARWQRSIGAYEGGADRVADQVATLERAIQALQAERDDLEARLEAMAVNRDAFREAAYKAISIIQVNKIRLPQGYGDECLREIQAESGRAGFIAGLELADSPTRGMLSKNDLLCRADEYAAKVRQGR